MVAERNPARGRIWDQTDMHGLEIFFKTTQNAVPETDRQAEIP